MLKVILMYKVLFDKRSWSMNPILKRMFLPSLLAIVCACAETPKGADSNHRQTAGTCDNTRPILPVTMVHDPAKQPCAAHSDCVDGANGRCTYYSGPGGEADDLYCSYDVCFTDSDCKSDQVCRCGEDIHAQNNGFTDENRCVASDCKIDADCSAKHLCKASPSECGDGITVGYFCTTDEDECRDSGDCNGGVCHSSFYDGVNRYFCGGADCD